MSVKTFRVALPLLWLCSSIHLKGFQAKAFLHMLYSFRDLNETAFSNCMLSSKYSFQHRYDYHIQYFEWFQSNTLYNLWKWANDYWYFDDWNEAQILISSYIMSSQSFIVTTTITILTRKDTYHQNYIDDWITWLKLLVDGKRKLSYVRKA